jgi:hypothetical protein
MRHSYRDLKTGEVFVIDLKIDAEAIAKKLALRARKSKVGTAKAMDGAIVCKIVKDAAP